MQSAMLMVKTSPIHGKGLFATKPIPWGTKIIRYTGKIISTAEANRRMRKGARYIFELSNDQCIDAQEEGNIARFINHSEPKQTVLSCERKIRFG